jgi:hypothetical protein
MVISAASGGSRDAQGLGLGLEFHSKRAVLIVLPSNVCSDVAGHFIYVLSLYRKALHVTHSTVLEYYYR